MQAPRVNRRLFLVGSTTVALAAACGQSDNETQRDGGNSGTTGSTAQDDLRFLQTQFADGFRAPTTLAAGGLERAVFGILDGDGLPVVSGAPEQLAGSLSLPDGQVVEATLPRRGAGLAAPHYPLLFEAPTPGVYELSATVEGQSHQLQFMVADPADVPLVQVGEPMRSVDTPTLEDARGVEPICTRFEPCPFHEINLADVVANGRPTALMIATPGFCQTVACGPVVDLLIDLDPGVDMDVVHAEVYTDPDQLDELGVVPELLTPTIDTYGMAFEPSLVVADAAGVVTARIDYAFDRDEIAAALDTATGVS